jgi:hypothetical protein
MTQRPGTNQMQRRIYLKRVMEFRIQSLYNDYKMTCEPTLGYDMYILNLLSARF